MARLWPPSFLPTFLGIGIDPPTTATTTPLLVPKGKLHRCDLRFRIRSKRLASACARPKGAGSRWPRPMEAPVRRNRRRGETEGSSSTPKAKERMQAWRRDAKRSFLACRCHGRSTGRWHFEAAQRITSTEATTWWWSTIRRRRAKRRSRTRPETIRQGTSSHGSNDASNKTAGEGREGSCPATCNTPPACPDKTWDGDVDGGTYR